VLPQVVNAQYKNTFVNTPNNNNKNIAYKMNTWNPSDSAPFPALINLTSFVVNRREMFKINEELTLANVTVLASLLISGAEIDYLSLNEELPAGTGAALGKAIKCYGGMISLYVSSGDTKCGPTPELSQLVAVSPSVALEYLTVQSLTIDSECMSRLCSSFGTKLTALRSLTIDYCRFDILLLAKWIDSLQVLESLDVRSKSFVSSGAETLFAGLGKLPAIVRLRLENIEIGVESLRQLGEKFLGELRGLILRENQLGNNGVSAIVDAIITSRRGRCKLEELVLCFNDIGLAGAGNISRLIVCSPHIYHINLDGNPKLGIIVSQALEMCAYSLDTLRVNKSNMGPRRIASLLALGYHALTTLDISANEAGDQGAEAVAKFLLRSGGRTLRNLYMTNNGITKAGALKLAKGLAKAYAILIIYVDINPLGPCGGAAVLNALADVSTVRMNSIGISCCNIGDAGASAAGKLIMHRGCIDMNLASNGIGAKSAKVIANSIHSSTCVMEVLNLYDNALGDDGIAYFLCCITWKNRSLCKLCMSLQDIGIKGAIAVKRAMKVQGALQELIYIEDVKDQVAEDILRETNRGSNYAKLVKRKTRF
ncbi:MAG: hypothetical protein P4L50_29030, partial [Anaerolineaceae bacterium]|nr:hypothetical protein [Anaerolineaceae bacterium]